jgi:hypothetical protein
MKWSWPIVGLMSTAGLLLPMSAVPESHVEIGATKGGLSATAHVTFKIVIPPMLFLQVGTGNERGNVILSGAARKSISQNSACTLGDVTRPVVCTASMP